MDPREMFGIPGPDESFWRAQQESLDMARRMSEMVRQRELDQQRALVALESRGVAEMQARMAQVNNQVVEAERLAAQCAPPLVARLQAGIAELIQPRDLLDLVAPPRDFFAESERRLRALQPKAEQLGQRGWTLPIRWGLPQFEEVVDEVSPDALDDAWLDYYTANEGEEFDELAEALSKVRLLDPWRHSLEGAIYAYRGRYYETAIPALLALFEGAVSAATRRLHRRHKVQKTAEEFRDASRFAMRALCWASLVGFSRVVFQYHSFGQPAPAGVNRHLVQHGRAMPPRPQIDCLRLLQALETLSLVARPE